MAERTQEQEVKLTQMAVEAIRADAVAALAQIRETERDAAQVAYTAATKAANDKYDASVASLEK